REQFWDEEMSGVDWGEVYQRYLPLVDRVSTRAEFSDLLWELHGELGTSHAYEWGGAYRPGPYARQGCLGVDFDVVGSERASQRASERAAASEERSELGSEATNQSPERASQRAPATNQSPEAGGYRIARILTGDRWDAAATSPLNRPGVDARVGDV